MYIASESQKNSSNYTRFFGADVVFFRQTGRKPANSGKNGEISAKKQFVNQINFHLYHYAGNNPVKFTDPDGKIIIDSKRNYTHEFMQQYEATWPDSFETISETGCTLIAANRAANICINLFGFTIDTTYPSSAMAMLNNPTLTNHNGMIFSGLKKYLKQFGVNVSITDTGKKGSDVSNTLKQVAQSLDEYVVIGRLKEGVGHYVNINDYNPETRKVSAFDTSMNKDGKEKRDLSNVDVRQFDRLILIKIQKSVEE